jgi:hypothetical protein
LAQSCLPPLPLELGGGRRARLDEPPEAGRGDERRALHQDRRGDRARPRPRPVDGDLADAALRRSYQAHVHEPVLEPHGDSLYNCFKVSEIATRGGFTRLGVEKVGDTYEVYEFAFMMQPLKIQGGTGSTVAPVAIR